MPNRRSGDNLDVNRFAHRAIWNEGASRVEMHLVSDGRQRVRVPSADLELSFEPGEAIWTESSYKAPDIAPMLAPAGFSVIGQWIENRYAVTLVLNGRVDP